MELVMNKINLYEYQEKIVSSLRNELKTNKKVLVSAPTGAG